MACSTEFVGQHTDDEEIHFGESMHSVERLSQPSRKCDLVPDRDGRCITNFLSHNTYPAIKSLDVMLKCMTTNINLSPSTFSSNGLNTRNKQRRRPITMGKKTTLWSALLFACMILPRQQGCESFRAPTTIMRNIFPGPSCVVQASQPTDVRVKNNSLKDSCDVPKVEQITFDYLLRQCKLLSISFLWCAVLILPAHAIDSSVFTNEYSDPFHPLCKRRIEVSADGKSFHYSGTAVGPKDDPVRRGCTIEEMRKYKLRTGAFDGIILDNGKISAGDGIHEGAWEPAGSATTDLGYEDVDGIRWNDGNQWLVIKKAMPNKFGEALVYSYIGLSGLAGLYGIYITDQQKRQTLD